MTLPLFLNVLLYMCPCENWQYNNKEWKKEKGKKIKEFNLREMAVGGGLAQTTIDAHHFLPFPPVCSSPFSILFSYIIHLGHSPLGVFYRIFV